MRPRELLFESRQPNGLRGTVTPHTFSSLRFELTIEYDPHPYPERLAESLTRWIVTVCYVRAADLGGETLR